MKKIVGGSIETGLPKRFETMPELIEVVEKIQAEREAGMALAGLRHYTHYIISFVHSRIQEEEYEGHLFAADSWSVVEA